MTFNLSCQQKHFLEFQSIYLKLNQKHSNVNKQFDSTNFTHLNKEKNFENVLTNGQQTMRKTQMSAFDTQCLRQVKEGRQTTTKRRKKQRRGQTRRRKPNWIKEIRAILSLSVSVSPTNHATASSQTHLFFPAKSQKCYWTDLFWPQWICSSWGTQA